MRQLDRGTRNILSDTRSRYWTMPAPIELASLDSAPAECAVADPKMEIKYLIADEPGSLGLALKAELFDGVTIITMNPVGATPAVTFSCSIRPTSGQRVAPGCWCACRATPAGS